jgi:short-subunit dehydrogenase
MQVRHRLIVVTGASSGIGEAVAMLLGERGARVVLIGRDALRLQRVAAVIESNGSQAFAHRADLADSRRVEWLAAHITADHGLPDVLINNAGAGRWLTVEETGAAELEAMMAVPYFAAFNLTRAWLPAMRRRGSGRIVNVTSVASRLVWPGATAYMAARQAMWSFSESLRAEVSGSGVGVTTAILGTVDTPYWTHNPGSEGRLPRAGAGIKRLTPDEVAQALVHALERDIDHIVRPRIFQLLFLVNALAPRTTARVMSRGWR